MKNTIKLAFRNLWRNKRRTVITASSVMFAAFFCMIMGSMLEGTTSYIVDSAIEKQTGHFQIQNPSYWDDKIIDNFTFASDSMIALWEKQPNVKHIAPRIETFAMGWNGIKTKPIILIGIEPERESRFSHIERRMVKGNYLTPRDSSILIGERLSQSMGLTIGDTLTLIGQGYHGSSAAGLFVVKGIIKGLDSATDNSIVYGNLKQIQHFIDMPNGVSSIAVALTNKADTNSTIAHFEQLDPNKQYTFINWHTLIKSTAAGMGSDKEGMDIFFYVLYIIVAFGLLSTIIMLTNERFKEFGVMAALGMKRSSLIGSLFLEMLFVNMLGLIASVALALPLISYLHYFPIRIGGEMAQLFDQFGMDAIIPFDLSASIFTTQIVVVLLLAILTTLYPLRKIRKMSIIEALRK